MSTLSSFMGGGATRAVVNAYSSGGTLSSGDLRATVSNGGKAVLSGALTANVLATALSVTGGGEVPMLAVYAVDTTSRTMRLQVTVDGTVVFNATSSACTISTVGIAAAGNYVSNIQPSQPIRFNSSLLVEIASSLSETDKIGLCYSLLSR